MKTSALLVAVLCTVAIAMQSFRCNGGIDTCPTITVDTTLLKLEFINPSSVLMQGDSVPLSSKFSDTIQIQYGSTFILANEQPFMLSVKMYQVISTGSGYEVSYANTAFDPYITSGQYGYANIGYNFLYTRLAPFYFFKGGFIAGRSGLFLCTMNLDGYYGYGSNYRNPDTDCTSYFPKLEIASGSRNLQYWDSLGTTTLRLQGTSNNLITKTDPNHFFIKVL